MKIGIFGGTFNPPHLGHKRLADLMAQQLDLDKILIIPTAMPPHKQAEDLASSKDRLRMCRHTFKEAIFEVSDIEIKREGKSYTFDTVTELKALYPEDELYLIIGSDMLLSFHRWYRYEAILSLVTLCVISREDEITAEKLSSYAKETLDLDAENGDIIICNTPPFPCSSTVIRDRFKARKSTEKFLEKDTFSYIDDKQLYSGKYSFYFDLLKEKLNEKRFAHSLCVADSAFVLAEKYGGNRKTAYFAGLLHDIMKNANDVEQLQIIEKGDIMLSCAEKNNKKLWHAIAGEAYLRKELGIKDSEILSAVRYHTTGKAGMTLLEKIIYVADFISDDRDYDDVGVMRNYALNVGLDEACLYGLSYSIKELAEGGWVIHPDSVDFYNELVIEKGK